MNTAQTRVSNRFGPGRNANSQEIRCNTAKFNKFLAKKVNNMTNSWPDAKTSEGLTENIRTFARVVVEQNPLHRQFMTKALANISVDEIPLLDTYIEFCLKNGLSSQYIAECYLQIVRDVIREQLFFRKNGAYRHSTFAGVANDVYFNPEYMSHYMYGLALTAFLWPNHLAMFTFFKKTLPTAVHGNYVEIGPGHGYYLMTAMLQSKYDSFLGVDISETSVAMTKDVISHFMGENKKLFEVRCLDFLGADLPQKQFDAVVSGEVLEHVEQPDLFLRRIREIAKDDAFIYVTTCINAPAPDHIYLFKSPEQVAQLFAACGLKIKDQLICPYEGKTLEESLAERITINVAYVLEKA
jgi:2-polyprenyl-3-methyl-5-hydroxy-6-metoxy-1,4-benzoquinol methylase